MWQDQVFNDGPRNRLQRKQNFEFFFLNFVTSVAVFVLNLKHDIARSHFLLETFLRSEF